MPSEPSVAVDAGQQAAKAEPVARHAAAPCRERWPSVAEASHRLAATRMAATGTGLVNDFRRSIVDFME